MVDTEGAVPNLEALSYNVNLRAGGQSIHKAAAIPFVVHNTRLHDMKRVLACILQAIKEVGTRLCVVCVCA